jgi:hypothetical protein
VDKKNALRTLANVAVIIVVVIVDVVVPQIIAIEFNA